MKTTPRILLVTSLWSFAAFPEDLPTGLPPAVDDDVVIENARIAVRVRRSDGRAVVSYKLGGDLREAVEVSGAIDGGGADAGGADSGGAATGAPAFRFAIAGDGPILECRPLAGVTSLVLSHRGRHALLPEIFGDDLVLRPDESGDSPLRLPGEHAVLHTLGDGDALLMASWPPAHKEILLRSGETDDGRRFLRTELPSRVSESIWISVLAGKDIWHETDTKRFAISEYRKVDWKAPFPARYRCDLRKQNDWGLTDSWMRQPTGDKVWMAFLGNGFPPLSMDAEEASLRIPRFRPGLRFPKNLPSAIAYAGPILIYPFAREDATEATRTPEGEWTVLDVLRNTLGGGWKEALRIGEGILQVEPFPKGFVFAATCGSTARVEQIFSEGREKDDVEAVRRAFADMMRFVRYNRARIEEYVAFAEACRESLGAFEASNAPSRDLRRAADDLGPLLGYLPDLLEGNRDAIQTPERCQGLTEEVIDLVHRQDPDKVKRVKELGVTMRTIGGRQDDMLAAYRMAAKAFRQRAAQIHATAEDPAVRGLLRDLREASRSILRVSSPYEECLFVSSVRILGKQ